MSRVSSIALTHNPEQHVLTVRSTMNFFAEFSSFCNQAYEKITDYLKRIDLLPGGEPIVCFHNMDLEHLDVEYGFPVAKEVNDEGDIRTSIIPAQKVVTAIDLGPYEQQDPTLEEMFSWIKENGHEMQGDIYYQYLNDPDRPTNQYLTKMMIPIKDNDNESGVVIAPK